MASITQDMRFRLALIKYADKYGISKAGARYKTNRQYIYRWNAAMMAPGTLLEIVPKDFITIRINILKKRSNLLITCAVVILMMD